MLFRSNPYFQFTPSNPWVAVNWRSRDDITFDLAPYLEKKGIKLVATGAKRLHPENNRIELADGNTVGYDYLIIATGPKLAFDEVPGAGPAGHTHSICTVNHAAEAGKSWEEFVKDPGHIVVGAMQGASCYGPAYEFAMIMDADLRRRNAATCKISIQSNNVEVDDRGYIYVTDRADTGLHILDLTGSARDLASYPQK